MIYYFGDSNTKGIGTQGSPKPNEWMHIPYSNYLTELSGMRSKNLAKCGQNFVLNIRELIKHLGEIERRAKVVIFQTQFFCNPLLRFPELEKDGLHDFVVTSYLLNKNPHIQANMDKQFSESDKQVMIDWSYKFEERRSYYEYLYLIDIFKYLSSKGINCKILHWVDPFTIKLPDNEFSIIISDTGCKTAMQFLSENFKNFTIEESTNGEWDDPHTDNFHNKIIAETIYHEIFPK